MGFGLTLKLFLSHLFTEPAVALEGLEHSIKDIIEILYFYFTELSLTACYVILFILAARFLLRKAPKIYSYALWGVVYFKLVSVLKLDFFRHSLIPQPQIDKIYYNITPDYTAFYSTEAGIVSQVNSELVAPVPVVTPIYTPALIWFTVLCVILAVSAVMYFRAYSKLKNSSLNNLKDNVYESDAISTPFVFGIIRPKIYLPEGLTEQQQNYIITHEKVHIRRGDHIVKLFAFVITCIHWFNPLVWLSFFLLEKDMEMSCDEKVLHILGNEHKKDYSYCILSLAADKKFVPKAYLSFDDSDTKKRIKNVLNYKKPAVVASVMTIIGIVVIAVGMLADSGVVYIPNAENTGNSTHQINFPVYDQRNEYNTEIFNTSFALLMHLPDGWSVKIPEDYDIAYPLVGTWNRMGIYDETNKLVGAIGYNIYDTVQTEPMAIYNQIALGNHYQFDVHSEDYFDVATADSFITSTTSVYTSAVMASQLGIGNNEVINHGVLSRNSKSGVYVAIEIDKNAMDEAELNNFAHSIYIAEPVIDNPYKTAATKSEISNFATDNDVIDILWSVAQKYGYSAAQIETLYNNLFWDYINSEFRLNGNDEHIKAVYDKIISGQTEQDVTLWVREQLTAQGFSEDTLKTLAHRSWSPIELYFMTDENANAFVAKLLDPNADSDYVVNRWDLSTSCAKESTEDTYVITYCDEKVVCTTGLLSFDNANDFDITVHLLSGGNGELKVDIPAGSTASLSVDSVKTEYTVGIYADVAADTDIILIVREVKTE